MDFYMEVSIPAYESEDVAISSLIAEVPAGRAELCSGQHESNHPAQSG